MNTVRTILIGAFAACALAGSAYGAYPGVYGMQGGTAGVTSVDGTLRFVAAHVGADTRISALRSSDLAEARSATVPGDYGIPAMITNSVGLGMFRDGSAFVLQSIANRSSTRFAIVGTSDLRVRQTITLPGSYAFDALSPDGSRLFLVQHRSEDFGHYVVRAYDLAARALLPGRIADKAQASWVMQGWPAARVTTTTGRWVYTLYSNPGGFPFVHALDTVKSVAHCVGIAWKGSQNPLSQYRLRVSGGRLLVLRPGGGAYRAIDRTTWAVTLK